ncbi:uncharacterized protein METZ01_LOCUS426143, partial [marine metagenome]
MIAGDYQPSLVGGVPQLNADSRSRGLPSPGGF